MGFVSRAGQKLEHALDAFALSVRGVACADLGANAGGFTDCLLQRAADRIYAIDTGYGMLDYRLRRDPRVIVMERTNAMHAHLPELVDFVCIDVAWTRQRHILPAARRMLAAAGTVVTLVKPHYEASARQLRGGVLMETQMQAVLEVVRADIAASKFRVIQVIDSPILGGKGNRELLALLRPDDGPDAAIKPAAAEAC